MYPIHKSKFSGFTYGLTRKVLSGPRQMLTVFCYTLSFQYRAIKYRLVYKTPFEEKIQNCVHSRKFIGSISSIQKKIIRLVTTEFLYLWAEMFKVISMQLFRIHSDKFLFISSKEYSMWLFANRRNKMPQ